MQEENIYERTNGKCDVFTVYARGKYSWVYQWQVSFVYTLVNL